METKGRERIDNIDVVRLHDPFRWLECAIRLFSSHSDTDCIYILGTPKFSVWAILIAKYIQHIPTTLVLTSKVEILIALRDGEIKYLHSVINTLQLVRK